MHIQIAVHVRQGPRLQNYIGREHAEGIFKRGHPVAEHFAHLPAVLYKSHRDSRMHVRYDPVSRERAGGIPLTGLNAGYRPILRHTDGIDLHAGQNLSAEGSQLRSQFIDYQYSSAFACLFVTPETPRTFNEGIVHLGIDVERKSLPVQFHLHRGTADHIPESGIGKGIVNEFR